MNPNQKKFNTILYPILIIAFILLGFGGNFSPALLKAHPDYEQQREPVAISDAESFLTIAKVISKVASISNNSYYYLTNDIDLSGIDWLPLGYQAAEETNDGLPLEENVFKFKGVFDGCGFKITGLSSVLPENRFGTGLFANNAGLIKNLIVETDEIGVIGDTGVGIITGYNSGKIENCITLGKSSGGILIGGIVGSLESGRISNSANYAVVNGQINCGGIAGYSNGYSGGANTNPPEILACANFGAVNGEMFVGGIVSANRHTLIADCLSLAEVFGDSTVGAIVGSYDNEITNCYYNIEINSEPCLIENSAEQSTGYAKGFKSIDLIKKSFAILLDNGKGNWTIRAPETAHYYPELVVFFAQQPLKAAQLISKQNALTTLPFCDASPIVSKTAIIYGDPLNEISFATDTRGEFFWQQQNLVPPAGNETAVYAYFLPFDETYGERFDIEILLNVEKASPELKVTIVNWEKGSSAGKAKISIKDSDAAVKLEYKKRNAPDSNFSESVPTKWGKYTLRASFAGSENYLGETDYYYFKITPDHSAYLFIIIIVLGAALIVAGIYFSNKQYKWLCKLIKPQIIIKEIIVEKPVEVIKYLPPDNMNKQSIESMAEKFTPREYDVALKILEGKQRKEIATELYISEETVKKHILSILQKSDCKTQKIFVIKFSVK